MTIGDHRRSADTTERDLDGFLREEKGMATSETGHSKTAVLTPRVRLPADPVASRLRSVGHG